MFLKILNLATFIIVLVMNYLANAIPINGKTTGQLSEQYPNLFVPAGITFSIWGVIYLLLLLFVYLQFRTSGKQVLNAIGWAFAISNILNALWILAWHYEKLPLSVLIMFGLLASLIFITFQLPKNTSFIFKAIFGIYLGWILIATIANVTAMLVDFNWSGWGISHQVWANVLIATGVLISIITLIRLNNPFLAISTIWAFIGIILKRQQDYPAVAVAAAVGIVLMGIIMVWQFKRFLKPGY